MRDPEVWGNFADGITQGLVDYCIKLRTHNVIAEEYELQDFPFDTQPLTLLVTVNIPITRAAIIGNEQYPSLFFHKAFQQKSVYDIVFKEQLHWELQQSDVPSRPPASSIRDHVLAQPQATLRLLHDQRRAADRRAHCEYGRAAPECPRARALCVLAPDLRAF